MPIIKRNVHFKKLILRKSEISGDNGIITVVQNIFNELFTNSLNHDTLNTMALSVGKKIRQARLAKDITQDELAYEIGISNSYLSHIERDQRIPDSDLLIKLAKALNVSPKEFFDEEEPPEPPFKEIDKRKKFGGEAKELVLIPFLGRIVASPEGKEYFEDIKTSIGIPFFPGNFFSLEIESDSMIEADIHPGDICVFEPYKQPRNGDIVAIQLRQNNNRMVKVLMHISADEIELQSANRFRNYPAIRLKKEEVSSYGIFIVKMKMPDNVKQRFGIIS